MVKKEEGRRGIVMCGLQGLSDVRCSLLCVQPARETAVLYQFGSSDRIVCGFCGVSSFAEGFVF